MYSQLFPEPFKKYHKCCVIDMTENKSFHTAVAVMEMLSILQSSLIYSHLKIAITEQFCTIWNIIPTSQHQYFIAFTQ